MERKEGEFLTPSDLGVVKQQLIARPQEGEVAVLRLIWDDDLSRTVYDQITYSPNEPVVEDILLIDLDDFQTRRDLDGDWILKVGIHKSPMEDLRFSSSVFYNSSLDFGIEFFGSEFLGYSENAVGGEIKFERFPQGDQSLDPVPADSYQFSLFIVPFEEIMKVHPEWEPPREGQVGGSWAYIKEWGLKTNQNSE